MSQTWIDDCYAADHQAAIDLQSFEDNFAALKSSFSGANAPSNPIAGMWWLDLTTHILKHRNEANNAWLSVWDMANNKPVIANLISADFAAALKDAAAETASLRSLGTGAQQAAAGNDSRLATVPDGYVTEVKIAAAAVSQAKLKTSQGEVSTTSVELVILTLPGGEYGFWPRIKISITPFGVYTGNLFTLSTTYVTLIGLQVSGGGTAYAQQRYVASSGEVFWLFLLREKSTKAVISTYSAPDHPCFGNGGDPEIVSHPFGDYDKDLQEIICVAFPQKEIAIIKAEVPKGSSLLQHINDVYVIDDEATPAWPTKEVTVGLPEDYDYLMAKSGDEVETIKMVIPKPINVLCKKLKLR